MDRFWLPAVVVVVLLTGCTEDVGECGENGEQPEPSAIAGEELPVEIKPRKQSPELDESEIESVMPLIESDAPIETQVLYDLQKKTLNMAGVIGDISPVGCEGGDIDDDIGATTRCTVEYEGVQVPWDVTVVGKPLGEGWGWEGFEYEASALKGVVTAEGVYNVFAWDLHQAQEVESHPQGRCDKIPNLVPVEIGEGTDYSCQRLSWSCTNGKWSFEWVDSPIWVNEEGILQFDPVD